MFRTVIVLVTLLTAYSIGAQEDEGDLHRFTDKKGQEIVARLLGVSEDRRSMRIRREDGKEFETEINVLSLDDQQYVKNWLESRSSEVDYWIEIDIDRKTGAADEFEMGSMTLERRSSEFELTFRNRSRETPASARYEYFLVLRDRVALEQGLDGEWDYTSLAEEGDPPIARFGRGELGDLTYNRDVSVTTDPMEINRVLRAGDPYLEDEPLGLIVRVIDEGGNVLAEVHSGGSELESLEWERVASFRDPTADD